MKITTDEQGFVRCFAYVGDLLNSLEVPEPEDIDLFLRQFYAFRYQDGHLIYDAEAYERHVTEETKEEYRQRREKECFSVVNRGWIWYSSLTLSQWRELRSWYLAWLNVTDTKVIPERPAWLDSTDASRIPLTPLGFL